MASVMGICGRLVEPKSGNVEKVVALNAFLKGQRSVEESKTANKYPSRDQNGLYLGCFEVEKRRFLM